MTEDLVCYLKERLHHIFNSAFERKFPTVWCTIGYFNHLDFDIEPNSVKVFKQWKNSDHFEITIKKLELVEYGFRDLRDAEKIETFQF